MRPPAVHTDPTTPYGGVGCTWVVVRAVSAQLNVCVCVSTTVSSSESARGDRPRGARSFGIRAQPDRVSTQIEIFGSVAIVSPPRVPSSPRPENYSAHRPVVPGPFPDPRISRAPPHIDIYRDIRPRDLPRSPRASSRHGACLHNALLGFSPTHRPLFSGFL